MNNDILSLYAMGILYNATLKNNKKKQKNSNKEHLLQKILKANI